MSNQFAARMEALVDLARNDFQSQGEPTKPCST